MSYIILDVCYVDFNYYRTVRVIALCSAISSRLSVRTCRRLFWCHRAPGRIDISQILLLCSNSEPPLEWKRERGQGIQMPTKFSSEEEQCRSTYRRHHLPRTPHHTYTTSIDLHRRRWRSAYLITKRFIKHFKCELRMSSGVPMVSSHEEADTRVW